MSETSETDIIWGKAIGMQTCVGVPSGKFPLSHGNCFSMNAEGKDYRIINFCCENLREAQNRGVEFPIKLKKLKECTSEGIAIVFDERIPHSWCSDHYCEVCTPKDLLPHNQQMSHERAIAGGWEKHHGSCTSYDWSKEPDLRTEEEKREEEEEKRAKLFASFKIKEEIGVCVINDYALAKVSVAKESVDDS